MPCCSVIVCKNQSKYVNYNNQGITYHLFPSEPNRKKKWINACGRGPNWLPAKSSAICSAHFKENCFQPLKRRRLYDWAVPTLKLRLIFAPISEKSLENEHGDSRSSIEDHQVDSPRRSSDEKLAAIKQEDTDETTSEDEETKSEKVIFEKVFVKSQTAKSKPGSTQAKRVRQDVDDAEMDFSEEMYEFGKFVAEQLLCLSVEEAREAQAEIKELLTKLKKTKTRRKAKPSTSKAPPKDKAVATKAASAEKPVTIATTQSSDAIRPVVQLVFPQSNILGKTKTQLNVTTPSVSQSTSKDAEGRKSGLETSVKEFAVVNLDTEGSTSAFDVPATGVVVDETTQHKNILASSITGISKDTSAVAQDPDPGDTSMDYDEISIKIEPADSSLGSCHQNVMADESPREIAVFAYEPEGEET